MLAKLHWAIGNILVLFLFLFLQNDLMFWSKTIDLIDLIIIIDKKIVIIKTKES
jgi:hypothetical protein